MYDVFISYSHKDKVEVLELCKELARNGISYWIDNREIKNGDEFKSVIVEAIEKSSIFLFISSINSNTSEWTAKEVGVAVKQRKHIIPIKLDESSYDKAVEFDLINIDFVDFSSKSAKKNARQKLITTIKDRCGNVVDDLDSNMSLDVIEHKTFLSKYSKIIIAVICLLASVYLLEKCIPDPIPIDEFEHAKQLLESDMTDSVQLGYRNMLVLADKGDSRAKIEVGITNFATIDKTYTTDYITARRKHLGMKDGNETEFDNVVRYFTTVTDSTAFNPETFYILGVVYFNQLDKKDSALYAFKKGEELLERGSVASHGYITSDLARRIKNNIKKFEELKEN